MHTISHDQRLAGRWRWIATALVVIFAQAVVAVVVRSDGQPAAAAELSQ
jgi:hypothetical protein